MNTPAADRPARSTRAAHILLLLCGIVIQARAGELLARFLEGPLRGVEEIVFAARGVNPTDGHWYANFGYYSHDSIQ